MSTIGGPGGIGGPKGPTGPERPDEVEEIADVAAPEASSDIDAIAADLTAGKITTREAVDRLVDHIAGTEHLGAAERAELREMLHEVVANDPYLTSLLKNI